MVHILGVHLFEANFVKHGLTQFYGISHHTANHDTCRVRHLSPTQITSIAAFLSSPSTSPIPRPPSPSTALQNLAGARTYLAQLDATPPPLPRVKTKGMDPLRWLRIETDLKRELRENIAHHRMIGSYRTRTNAKTAKKLNRVERHR
ncbi:hypothetical protein BJV77DRAFT_996809 [Russula vinacea]|nr:hypothetical protein BJV77DRAFT_996809 [Russula vinacea]